MSIRSRVTALFGAFMAMAGAAGNSRSHGSYLQISQNDKGESFITGIGTGPIYHPRKHTVQTYRSQQRAAKARRRAK